MQTQTRLTRRDLIKTAALGTIAAGFGTRIASPARADSEQGQRIPLKLGIRAASMQMVGDFDVIKTAASIPGIMGVELQTTQGKANLRDWDVVRRYKKEADQWAMRIPSLAGVWDRGVNIQSPAAGESVIRTIRAAEMLGCGVILLAFFKQDAPDMTCERSYGPIVTLLEQTAKCAADAGVVMGLENSLSPADNKKLVDLVDHPAVGVHHEHGVGDHLGQPGP